MPRKNHSSDGLTSAASSIKTGSIGEHQSAWQDFIKWSITGARPCENKDEIFRFEPDHLFSKIFNNSTNHLVVSLMDVTSQRYKYVSPNVRDVVGWTSEELMEGGVKFVFDRLHPDDIPAAIVFSERINNYYRQLPELGKDAYCGQWDFRVRNPQGAYHKYIQKDHVLKHTDDGRIAEYLVFFSRIENYKSHKSQHLLLTDGDKNILYKHDHKTRKTYLLETLTKRELEVIRLISNSFSLKETASELGISFNTVRNHSKNILTKLEAKDSMEAVNLMRILGFI